MDIQQTVRDIGSIIRNNADQAVQDACALALKAKSLRNDPEAFEKICQVAIACLQLLIPHLPNSDTLKRFTFILTTAQLHDFYSFLKQPRQWFRPINVDLIDENSVRTSLIEVLQASLDPNQLNVTAVEALATECLEKRLTSMREHDDAYRTVDEFKDVLQIQIRKLGQTRTPFNCAAVDLTSLDVKLRHVPFGEKLTNFNWSIVDVGCVGLYFSEWQLLDLSKWASAIGRIPVFQGIKGNSFEVLVLGLVCNGFALKLIEATRKLFDDALTEQERIQAKVNIATSATELALYGTMLLNRIGQLTIQNSTIQWLMIASKSFGILCIAARQPHVYFQPKVAPAA